MDEHTKVNRDFWDEISPHHAASEHYDVEAFVAGKNTLGEIELAEVGEIAGKTMVHLQCHIGLDTLSWARRGAKVTGVDFSTAALEIARDLAVRTELDVQFVESDVYLAPETLDGQTYDIVFTSRGVLMWLGDLDAWASVCAQLLKPGGRFYVLDIHPLGMVVEQNGGALALNRSYFTDPEPHVTREDRSYAVRNVGLVNDETHEWIHPIGDIVTSLIRAGITIDSLREWPTDDYAPTTLSANATNAGEPRLPGLFSISGHREN